MVATREILIKVNCYITASQLRHKWGSPPSANTSKLGKTETSMPLPLAYRLRIQLAR
jgi:hypothetical protein